MEKVKLETEFIKLDQFLKWVGEVDSGADAKLNIQQGKIRVNGSIELQRGKKIRPGDTVDTGKKVYEIE